MDDYKYEAIEPQPTKRLLPYKNPLDGLYWSEDGTTHVNGPEWANACVKVSELHCKDVDKLAPDIGRLLSCYGPSCPGGENGCNAKGCFGSREEFVRRVTGDIRGDAWIWVSKGILTEMFPAQEAH